MRKQKVRDETPKTYIDSKEMYVFQLLFKKVRMLKIA